MSDESLRAAFPRLERNLQTIIDAEAAKRCIVCAHVKHNELAYCQVGQCPCSTGTSISSTASIVLRDLRAAFDGGRS